MHGPEWHSGEEDANPIWIGETETSRRIRTQIYEAAGTDLPVLITGEMGTGRRHVARALHRLGARAGFPFVPFDCSGLHPSQVDRLLFGSVPVQPGEHRSVGCCEEARGGTLFLEELAELPPPSQFRLVDIMRWGELRRPGIPRKLPLDLRWIGASQRDLGKLSRAGVFCPELYYRLSVVTIALPPLRERASDVALLARHFVRQYTTRRSLPHCRITPEALDALRTHDWPGNVWELKRTTERALVLSEGGEILSRHVHLLPSALPRETETDPSLIGIVPRRTTQRPDQN